MVPWFQLPFYSSKAEEFVASVSCNLSELLRKQTDKSGPLTQFCIGFQEIALSGIYQQALILEFLCDDKVGLRYWSM